MTTPTVAEVVERIRELVHAITQGRESLMREFTMRVPAEPKRDADLVLSAAAHLLEREHKARLEAERERDGMMTRWHMACDDYGQMKERAETAERELAESERKLNIANGTIANLMDAGCPYCLTSAEGTSYCTLAERTVEAETRKREEAESERDANLRRWSYSESKLAECEASLTKAADELAALRKRVAEAPRGMVRGFMLEPETQPGWLDKMGGKRVAIVPLREGE